MSTATVRTPQDYSPDELDRLAELMLDVYRGHPDHYARYASAGNEFPSNYAEGKKRSERSRAPMNRQSVLRHLRGEDSAGVYHIDDDHKVWLGEFDVDDHDGKNPRWRDDAKQLYGLMKDAFGVQPIVSTGKSGDGVHITVPFSDRVEAWKLRKVVAKLVKTRLPEKLHGVEFFPKQDAIGPDLYGNLTRLPLWGKSQFVDPENDFEPIDPLEALQDVDKATAMVVDDLFDELFQGDDVPVAPEERKSTDAAETFDGVLAPAETLMKRCEFAKQVKDDAEKLPYDHWYKGVGLFARSDGGSTLVHELSKPYPGYSFEETQAKIAEVLKADGPPSCESIAGATGGQFCDGCPARLAAGKDGSTFENPLVLARRRAVKDGEVERSKTPADLVADAEGVLADLGSLSKEQVFAPSVIAALTTLYHHDRAKYELFASRVPTGTKTGVQAAVKQLAKKAPPENRKPRVDPMLREDDPTKLPVVLLQGGSIRVTETAEKLGEHLAKLHRMFIRGGVVMMIELDKDNIPVLIPVRAASLPAEFESVARLARLHTSSDGVVEKRPTICSETMARTILHSSPFLAFLPPIEIMSRCPILIERDDQLVEVSGYDRESRILATGGPVPEVPLDEAVRLISELVADFCFRTPADHSRAMAAILAPGLVHGGLLGGRAPVDLSEANESQTGKGYRNKITAAVYNDKVKAITQRSGGVGSLDEKFDEAVIKGFQFTCLDNIVGKLRSPSIESFCTEDNYSARAPHTRNVDIDPRRMVLMMTSNKAEISTDFANRTSCVLIIKQPAGYEFRSYPEGDILSHVRGNQPKYLGAIFAIIREWHKAGKPQTNEFRHDFRKWARVLDWIIQKIFKATPLMDGHESTQKRMVNPAKNWLRDVTLAVQRAGRLDEWLRTKHLLDVISAEPDIKIPGLKEGDDPEDEAVHTKVLQSMGRELSRCFTASDTTEIDGIEIEKRATTDSEWRPRPEYRFSSRTPYPRKETPYENNVFPENPLPRKEHWKNAQEKKKKYV